MGWGGKKKAGAAKKPDPVTTSGRVVLDPADEVVVRALCKEWSSTLRQVYVECVVGETPWFVKGSREGLRSQLEQLGWNQGEATSFHVVGQAAQSSLVERTKLLVEQGEAEIEKLEAKLAHARTGKRKKRTGVTRHRWNRRLQGLRSKVALLKRELDEGALRITFGGKKLARAGNDPVKHGYADHAEWRARWDRVRSAHFYVVGCKDRTAGNHTLRLHLSDDGDRLTWNVPRHLKHLTGGREVLSFEVRGLSYRRSDLAAALQRPAVGKGVRGAVSMRVMWDEKRAGWYVQATVDPVSPGCPGLSAGQPVLGVDVNADHLAWALVLPDGNPARWGRVELDLSGNANQRLHQIGNAVKELLVVAQEHGAAVACEDLHLEKAKAGLRYRGKEVARTVANLPYRRILKVLAARCRDLGIPVLPVDPAYTSVLGQANYAGTHGVSVDQAAACMIARAGLGLENRARRSVHAALPRARAGKRPRASLPTHRVRRRATLNAVLKALPPRRATWSPGGLYVRSRPPNPFWGGTVPACSGRVQAARPPDSRTRDPGTLPGAAGTLQDRTHDRDSGDRRGTHAPGGGGEGRSPDRATVFRTLPSWGRSSRTQR